MVIKTVPNCWIVYKFILMDFKFSSNIIPPAFKIFIFLYMHKNSESMHKKYKQWLSLIERLAVEMLLLKGVRNERK